MGTKVLCITVDSHLPTDTSNQRYLRKRLTMPGILLSSTLKRVQTMITLTHGNSRELFQSMVDHQKTKTTRLTGTGIGSLIETPERIWMSIKCKWPDSSLEPESSQRMLRCPMKRSGATGMKWTKT